MRDVEGDVTMSHYKQFESSLEIKAAEMPDLDDAAWRSVVGRMTDEFANHEMKLLIQSIEEAAAATGNSASLGH